MIVLDSLLSRKMVFDERGANAPDLVGADRRADSAAADRDAALDLLGCDGSGQWNDEIGIVVSLVERMRAEIDHFVPRRSKLCQDCFLKAKTTVIRCQSHTHGCSFSAQVTFDPRLHLDPQAQGRGPAAPAPRESRHPPEAAAPAAPPYRRRSPPR